MKDFVVRNPIWLVLFLALILMGTGCQGLGVAEVSVLSTDPQFNQPQVILIRQVPNATITPTPFQPLPITATSPATISPTPELSPTPTAPILLTSTSAPRTWVGYPGPVIYPPLPIPPPMGIFEQPDNQINILLMGTDQRYGYRSFRTDVMLLVTINADKRTVSLTSFPRDLYVYMPGWTMERINTAQKYGGFEMTALTFEYNFGVKVDHWAMVNYEGFEKMIDTIGGIDVEVGKEISDWRGTTWYTVPAGTVHMEGDQALWYARSRKTTNDFDRTKRTQEVLQAIFFKLVSLDGLTQIPTIYDQLDDFVQTDLELADITELAPLAAHFVSGAEISTYAIGSQHVSNWINPYNGAQVLIPDQEAIRSLLNEVLVGP